MKIKQSNTGWNNVIDKAKSFGKKPTLYCVIFKHNKIKVGVSINIEERLIALSSHGLFVELFSDIILRECEKYKLYNIEKIALNKMMNVTKQLDIEVFKAIPICKIEKIFDESISESVITKHIRQEEIDYHELALKSNLYGTLYCLARKKRLNQSKDEAIQFILSNFPEDDLIDEQTWRGGIELLHPFVLEWIKPLGIKNAILIGQGYSKIDRKLTLSKFIYNCK